MAYAVFDGVQEPNHALCVEHSNAASIPASAGAHVGKPSHIARRASRDFTPEPVPESAISALLYAAVQAPTAKHEQAWMFAVIQDRAILKALSDKAGELLTAAGAGIPARTGENFNVFYDAGTLIVVYGPADHRFAVADCWLAAENMMLLACSMGLGTCVIGMALDALNTAEWKQRLKIPDHMTAIAPVIVGTPATRPEAVTRQPPKISCWI